MASIEQDIYEEFSLLSSINLLDINDAANIAAHFNIKYGDKLPKSRLSKIPFLPGEPDYRLEKYLKSGEINFDTLLGLYPARADKYTPTKNDVNKPMKSTMHKRWHLQFDYIKINLPIIKTTIQSVFVDNNAAKMFVSKLRWQNGEVVSPFSPTSKVYLCKGGRYKCKNSGKYFNELTGTIFSDTKVPLYKWFIMMYTFASNPNTVSTHEYARQLGVTQRTAWFMLRDIRTALGEEFIKQVADNLKSLKYGIAN